MQPFNVISQALSNTIMSFLCTKYTSISIEHDKYNWYILNQFNVCQQIFTHHIQLSYAIYMANC